MKNNDIDQHREMSTDDISRYEFSKRIYSYQTRFNYPSPFTQTTKITHANNIVKHDGYSLPSVALFSADDFTPKLTFTLILKVGSARSSILFCVNFRSISL